MEDQWYNLYNNCIKLGKIPEAWRTSVIKIIPKGKGDTSNQDSYRGIALENSAFKIFSKILTKQITTMVDKYIPECQFGLRKGRSTIQLPHRLD